MRILHTSDWHIGKKVNEFSMVENQEYVFEQIYEILERERIDVVIIAGDLYDKPIVDTDSIKFLNDILVKFVKVYKVKVILVSGNHDSADRLSFMKEFLSESGIYIEGKFNGKINKIVLNDEFGEINFYPLSYFDEVYVKHLYDDLNIKTSNDALHTIMEKVEIDYTKRNIFIGHGYFSNKDMEKMIESESERRLSIGGQEVMDSSILKDFDYVALGHLHAPQKVIYDHIRYSGSIVKYSFSEMKQKKSVTIIDIKEKGNIEFYQIDLKLKYDMKEIEGYIETLTSREFYKDKNLLDYYRVILHDSIGISDPISKLRKVYKNVMEVKFKDAQEELEREYKITNSDISLQSPYELFQKFYMFVSNKELNDEQMKIIKDVLKDSENLENK